MGITVEGDHRRPTNFTPIPRKFDIIVGLGQNYRLGWNKERLRKDKRRLSTPSKRVAIAALMHYQELSTQEIIFSTGHTSGDDIDSEATAMKKYALKKFPTVPERVIKVEEISKDTSGNAEEVGKRLKMGGYDRRALLAPSYHRRRAMGLFEAWEADVTHFLSAEEKLKTRSKHHARYIEKLKRSPSFWFAEYVKEFVLNAERYLLSDPKALIVRKITSRSRR